MSDTKKFTTRTASLKATKADIIKLDVKLLNINGEKYNTIKDIRGENITENDIWPNPINNTVDYLTSDTDGNIVYQGLTNNTFNYSEMTTEQKAITQTAVKVIDNKVLGENDELLMNWDTKSFTNNNNGLMYDIFNNSSTITEWNSDLSSLTNSNMMFLICSNLTTFNGDLSSLTSGSHMFYFCNKLTSFDSDLPSLTDGSSMFQVSALTSFDSDLSSITKADRMFYGTALESFNSDLSSLTDGSWMFYSCKKLTSFNSDLSSLIDGYFMFSRTALTSFDSDLSSLTNGINMFSYTALESFDSDLSSLTNGSSMFDSCKLDADSLNNIIHTINTHTSTSNITIGLGYNDPDNDKPIIADICCCDSWEELNKDFSNKGWTVEWQWNGPSTSSNTLNELDGQTTPLPIWAKLEEVTDEKGHYGYVIEDDTTKHFNIHWYHESNGDNEGYQQFGSLLEACGYFGVIPKEYSEQ